MSVSFGCVLFSSSICKSLGSDATAFASWPKLGPDEVVGDE